MHGARKRESGYERKWVRVKRETERQKQRKRNVWQVFTTVFNKSILVRFYTMLESLKIHYKVFLPESKCVDFSTDNIELCVMFHLKKTKHTSKL